MNGRVSRLVRKASLGKGDKRAIQARLRGMSHRERPEAYAMLALIAAETQRIKAAQGGAA